MKFYANFKNNFKFHKQKIDLFDNEFLSLKNFNTKKI